MPYARIYKEFVQGFWEGPALFFEPPRKLARRLKKILRGS